MDAFNNERYTFSSVYSEQDISEVKKWQDEEQIRRINDVSGEAEKKILAFKVSELFSESIHTNWFSQGSSFLFKLIQTARSKAVSLKSSASLKTIETVDDVKSKLDGVKSKSIRLSTEFTSIASQKSKETVQDIKSSAVQTQAKGLEKASEVQDAIKEKLGSAQTAIQEAAQQGVKKVQGVALSFTESSRNLWGRLNKSFTTKTSLAFLLLEEENERAYRMSSDSQMFAVLNGLAVSSLIKDLGYEFYRPTSEPSRLFSTRLLESFEKQSRVTRDLDSQLAVQKSKEVADLMEHKWKGTAPTSAALVAVKAQVMEEIKTQKLVGASM